jgi:hypothetical protein
VFWGSVNWLDWKFIAGGIAAILIGLSICWRRWRRKF